MFRTLTLFVLMITLISNTFGIAGAQVTGKRLSGEARALAIYTPPPRYPREARRKGEKWRGVASVEVDSRTGNVTSARMLQTTGYGILDNAALDAFYRWRFRPGTVSHVRIPISFTKRGLFY